MTEAELIAKMDKEGIGTDATMAQHIQTIQVRDYATMSADRRFRPTQLGLGLHDGYESMRQQLSKPYLRANMEVQFPHVCATLILRGE